MCVLVHYMYFDIYLWDGAARLEGRKATQAATRREKIGGDRVGFSVGSFTTSVSSISMFRNVCGILHQKDFIGKKKWRRHPPQRPSIGKMSQDTQYTLVSHMRYSVTWSLRYGVVCLCVCLCL